MRMKKVFKAMLAATACACMLTMPLNIRTGGPTGWSGGRWIAAYS